MKHRKHMAGLIFWAAFIAATLQGSRVPDDTINSGQQFAQVRDALDYRSGSGSDKEEYPPRSESMFT